MSQEFNLSPIDRADQPRSGDQAIYTHLDDVLSDPRLATAKKKEILASWISDARAVEDAPALRRLDSGSVVPVDAILRALVSLDEQSSDGPDKRPWLRSLGRRRSIIAKWARRTRGRDNPDDDDPPPAPAGFGIPFRQSFVAAHGARLAQPRKLAIG